MRDFRTDLIQVCPITTTEWAHNKSTIVTTLTTSTITVTSCPGGCHGKGSTPTVGPATETKPNGSIKTYTIPATSTITSFVPCSTPVNEHSGTTFYSTWLTVTYLTSTYLTTSYETVFPTSTPAVPNPPKVTVNPAKPSEHWTGVVTDVTTLPPTTVVGVASGTCPAPETVYETIVSYITVNGNGSPNSPPTATPVKPGSTLSWSASGSASGHAKPTGHAQPSGHAKPSGY